VTAREASAIAREVRRELIAPCLGELLRSAAPVRAADRDAAQPIGPKL